MDFNSVQLKVEVSGKYNSVEGRFQSHISETSILLLDSLIYI